MEGPVRSVARVFTKSDSVGSILNIIRNGYRKTIPVPITIVPNVRKLDSIFIIV